MTFNPYGTLKDNERPGGRRASSTFGTIDMSIKIGPINTHFLIKGEFRIKIHEFDSLKYRDKIFLRMISNYLKFLKYVNTTEK